jgi:hypothetical protein
MLDSMLQKISTGVEPHYLDVWLSAHDDDEATMENLSVTILSVMHNLSYIYTYSIFCRNDIQKS